MNRARARRTARAILESNSLAEAYKKTHPKCSWQSYKDAVYRLYKNNDVMREF